MMGSLLDGKMGIFKYILENVNSRVLQGQTVIRAVSSCSLEFSTCIDDPPNPPFDIICMYMYTRYISALL